MPELEIRLGLLNAASTSSAKNSTIGTSRNVLRETAGGWARAWAIVNHPNPLPPCGGGLGRGVVVARRGSWRRRFLPPTAPTLALPQEGGGDGRGACHYDRVGASPSPGRAARRRGLARVARIR